jgi:hypothetical protein
MNRQLLFSLRTQSKIAIYTIKSDC